MDSATRISTNLDRIQSSIASAAERSGRAPESVRLVAVTKYVGLDEVRALYALGVRDLAENRVDKAAPKIEALRNGIRWHMVGNVQRRKAREVVQLFDVLDALDRPELAEALQARCEQAGRRLDVLLEVNVSGEASKHGVSVEQAPVLLERVRACTLLQPLGFMTMAPLDADEAEKRAVFRRLRALADAHGLPECSMGMSDDFEIAIEEGSTQVRIGRALFD